MTNVISVYTAPAPYYRVLIDITDCSDVILYIVIFAHFTYHMLFTALMSL